MPDQNNTTIVGSSNAPNDKGAENTTSGTTGRSTASEKTGTASKDQNRFTRTDISRARKTPDDLNSYIRVTNPGVWILIAAIMSMMAGVLCWGIFGHVDRTLDTAVYVKNGRTVCYVNENYVSEIEEGMTVRYSNTEGIIGEIGPADDGTNTCSIKAERTLDDGYYNGTIVLEKISPVSFLLD